MALANAVEGGTAVAIRVPSSDSPSRRVRMARSYPARDEVRKSSTSSRHFRCAVGYNVEGARVSRSNETDLEITAAVSEAVSIPVVASGGAGKPEHLADAITIGKADAALAASIFHFGEYTIEETKRVMADRGIPVRAKS